MAALMVWRAGEATFPLRVGFSFGARGVVVSRARAGSSATSSRSAVRRLVSFVSSSAIFARMSASEFAIKPLPIAIIAACCRRYWGHSRLWF
jgi:hypothetical protein